MINRISGVEMGSGRQKLLPDYTRGQPAGLRQTPDWTKQVEKFIGDHPVASLAIGFTIGIVLGCLIKRR